MMGLLGHVVSPQVWLSPNAVGPLIGPRMFLVFLISKTKIKFDGSIAASVCCFSLDYFVLF